MIHFPRFVVKRKEKSTPQGALFQENICSNWVSVTPLAFVQVTQTT